MNTLTNTFGAGIAWAFLMSSSALAWTEDEWNNMNRENQNYWTQCCIQYFTGKKANLSPGDMECAITAEIKDMACPRPLIDKYENAGRFNQSAGQTVEPENNRDKAIASLPRLRTVGELTSFLKNNKGQGKAARLEGNVLEDCTYDAQCLMASGGNWQAQSVTVADEWITIMAEGDVEDVINNLSKNSQIRIGQNNSGSEKEPDENLNDTEPLTGWRHCPEESAANLTARREIEWLERNLRTNRLQKETLIQENNNLIWEARKSLGGALVSKIIEIMPTSKIPVTRDFIEKLFSVKPSEEMIKKVDNFIKQAQNVKEKVRDNQNEFDKISNNLEEARKQQEKTENLLHECRNPNYDIN